MHLRESAVVRRASGCGDLRRRAWVRGVTTPMMDSRGREHDVSHEEVATGRSTGVYRTLCGERITSVALTAAPGRPCTQCVLELDPAPDLDPGVVDSRLDRRVVGEWLHRLVRRAGSAGAARPATVGGPR